MPNLPVFLAGRVARWFGAPVQVVEVEEPDPWLRQVWFAGESLRGKSWRAGQEVEFHVGGGAFRHYTPCAWDSAAGRFAVLFHLHGRGPGGRWAADLKVGDCAQAMGPGGRFGLVPARRHVMVGDETTIGLFAAMQAAAREPCACLLELEPDATAAAALVPGAQAVTRGATRGEALEPHLRGLARAGDVAYLSGHAGTIQRLRRVWTGELGLPAGAVRTKAYWADGKAGL